MVPPQPVVPQTLAEYPIWDKVYSFDHRPPKHLVDKALRAQCFRAFSFYAFALSSARPSSSFVTRLPKTWSIL